MRFSVGNPGGRFLRAVYRSSLLLAAVLLTFSGWFKAVRVADRTPFFIDEVVNIQAAVNFLTVGDYSSPFFSGSFSPRVSSGLASTWPGAVPFLFHAGDLFTARLCQALWWWLLSMGLVMAYLTRGGCSWWLGLPVAAFSWVIVLSLPYNEAFLQSLGELGGAVMLGWGLLFLRTRPFVGGVLCGVCVWNCKLLYVPAVALLLLCWWWARADGGERTGMSTRRMGIVFIGFLLPLVLWCVLIVLHSGWIRLSTWTEEYTWFFRHRGSGFDSGRLSLSQRLQNLEWRTYSPAVKTVILGSTLGSAVAGGLCVAFRRSLGWGRDRNAGIAAAAAVISLFSAWWFAASPLMWIRYLQPAMLIGLGLWGYLAFHVGKRLTEHRPGMAHLFAVALFLLAAGHAWTTLRRSPAISKIPSYARTCQDIFSVACSKELPMHLPPAR